MFNVPVRYQWSLYVKELTVCRTNHFFTRANFKMPVQQKKPGCKMMSFFLNSHVNVFFPFKNHDAI